MKNILVTGSTGFIGSNIVRILKNKYKITTLIRNKKKIKNKNINYLFFKNNDHLDTILKLKI